MHVASPVLLTPLHLCCSSCISFVKILEVPDQGRPLHMFYLPKPELDFQGGGRTSEFNSIEGPS